MMDTTSSIKNDRIKKENKLQITKVTPQKKRNAIWKGSKDEKKNAMVVGLLKKMWASHWQQLHDLTLRTLFSNPNHNIFNLNVIDNRLT